MTLKNKKALSTLWLIILILIAFIFGSIVSYLLVMGIYYKMPENSTLLIVTSAEFTDENARYFNVSILNPSNSVSDTNITGIRLSVEGTNQTEEITDIGVYNATGTQSLTFPYTIQKGTEPKFKCNKNWSPFVGEEIKIEPIAVNASTKSYSYATPNVKLGIAPNFNASDSIEHFNVTVTNTSGINKNLTISDILLSSVFFFEAQVPTVPDLPQTLVPNQTLTFQCNQNWESVKGYNATVTVRTVEGFEATYITEALQGAAIYIDPITFDYADTSYFNLTVGNVESSTMAARISRVNLTLADGTNLTLSTSPPIDILPIPVPPNDTLTLKCFWDWSATRNQTIIATVYTKEGFSPISKIAKTPASVVWDITEVEFDLRDIGHFTVNVTNFPTSLQSIIVTQIWLNENLTETTPSSAELSAGEGTQFSCTFNWAQLKGQSVTITAVLSNGLNISQTITPPSVELKIVEASFKTSPDGRHFNLTISNPAESLQSLTIDRITVNFGNTTAYQSEGIGSLVQIGQSVTFTFSWNWGPYQDQNVKISVHTTQGYETSETFTAIE
ncbi:MAG TPA: hypothetical protein VIH48_00740 [Candidatus Bathyarchaeia archaeon]